MKTLKLLCAGLLAACGGSGNTPTAEAPNEVAASPAEEPESQEIEGESVGVQEWTAICACPSSIDINNVSVDQKASKLAECIESNIKQAETTEWFEAMGSKSLVERKSSLQEKLDSLGIESCELSGIYEEAPSPEGA